MLVKVLLGIAVGTALVKHPTVAIQPLGGNLPVLTLHVLAPILLVVQRQQPAAVVAQRASPGARGYQQLPPRRGAVVPCRAQQVRPHGQDHLGGGRLGQGQRRKEGNVAQPDGVQRPARLGELATALDGDAQHGRGRQQHRAADLVPAQPGLLIEADEAAPDPLRLVRRRHRRPQQAAARHLAVQVLVVDARRRVEGAVVVPGVRGQVREELGADVAVGAGCVDLHAGVEEGACEVQGRVDGVAAAQQHRVVFHVAQAVARQGLVDGAGQGAVRPDFDHHVNCIDFFSCVVAVFTRSDQFYNAVREEHRRHHVGEPVAVEAATEAANTGLESSWIPMPAHCAPWPVKTKASLGCFLPLLRRRTASRPTPAVN
ncbi:hypothetical protein PoMZ_02708 [Pyricularia oryzae]|uniref:Uncharacterized protein n=1 Tax=Pyricularia oryzae TaxID=318829 RepID=A0A4P7N5Z1_PYROR|nr:hypothetical protein PoMZ_02708 [Pyricularia oryzae]